MSEIVKTYSTLVAGVENEKDVVVIILSAHREDENGEKVSITESQAESAMSAARSVMECLGAEVGACCNSYVIPSVELAENENLTLKVSSKIVKATAGEEV